MGDQANIVTKPQDALANLLSKEMAQVNELISQRMASQYAPRIPEVTAHLINAGGKRMRPLLTLASASICGYTGGFHIHLAAPIDFIHTATLLHDDVVDESAQRRGRPTANLLWDNKSSILVGDYLFSRAFQLMVDTGSLDVLAILSNASATIAEGEVLQLSAARDLPAKRWHQLTQESGPHYASRKYSDSPIKHETNSLDSRRPTRAFTLVVRTER